MECTGKLTGAARSFDGNSLVLTFEVDRSVESQVEQILEQDKLTIKAVKFRQKRSLNANAYFHTLVAQIADERTISKARSKNELICKYGQPELLPDGSPMVYKTNAPVEYMLELESIHCIPVKYDVEDGVELTVYKIYRGSHTYNTKEMSVLIDGTVEDAKELGIETKTPDEIERMKQEWNV